MSNLVTPQRFSKLYHAGLSTVSEVYKRSVRGEISEFFNKQHQEFHLLVLVGKEGVEPSRLSARDPKSRLSANSSTSPDLGLYVELKPPSIMGYNPCEFFTQEKPWRESSVQTTLAPNGTGY